MTNLSGTNLNNGAAVGPQGEGMDGPSTFAAYPAYKDSGVEWLGEVPEDWVLARGDAYLRSQAKVVSADYLSGKEVFHYSIPVVQATGDGQLEDGDEIDSSKLLVEQSQVLISKLNPRKNTVCHAWPREVTTVCSGEFVPLQSDCSDLKWIYYLVSSENFRKRLESLVESATRSHQRVNPSDILKFRGAFPSLAEQTQIARFLDHETARIDALIEEQQRLIELLKEKRQAVISHAVTKGLDPTVPMKDSGVEWLGEVPAHWACGALARVAERVVVGIAEAATHAYADEGVPILRATNIRPGRIIGELLYINYDFADGLGSKLMRAGDLVTVRTGNAGVTAVVPEDLEGCQCFTMLITTLSRNCDSEYYCLLLNSHYAKTYFDLEGWGTAQVNISVPILKWLPVPIPPLHEQQEVSKYLRGEMLKIDALIDSANEVSGLLSERRSALISAAVTGKIDVRGWQPPVSTQAPEPAVAEAN